MVIVTNDMYKEMSYKFILRKILQQEKWQYVIKWTTVFEILVLVLLCKQFYIGN